MTTEPSTRKQVGTQLDIELYTRLRSLAVLQNRRVGALIDDAIAAYLDKHGVPSKPQPTKRTK